MNTTLDNNTKLLNLAFEPSTNAFNVNVVEDKSVPSITDNDEKLNLVIKLLLQKAADDPIWYDAITNALRITGSVAATISSGTVTTVGTVSNQTNMGGSPADLISENLTEIDWSLSTRNLLT